jgi:hypothetical protein
VAYQPSRGQFSIIRIIIFPVLYSLIRPPRRLLTLGRGGIHIEQWQDYQKIIITKNGKYDLKDQKKRLLGSL